MDLLGDLGAADQLTSAREENKVLREKVKRLEGRVKVLTVENETLKAEVEMYRKESALPSFSKLALGGGTESMDAEDENISDAFVHSGNGIYPSTCDVTLPKLHGISNTSCCSLSMDDTILATGGADSHVRLCLWGASYSMDPKDVVASKTIGYRCDGPVISVDFARVRSYPFLAAGCMDGTVQVLQYEHTTMTGLTVKPVTTPTPIKHGKYVKTLKWSPTAPIFASASADGSVQIHKVIFNALLPDSVQIEKIQSLQLSGPVESLCFVQDTLCCYARGTPYLSYFNMAKEFEQTKINLNQGAGNAGFADHVSFAVMDLVPFENKYLALATDTSRNIIIDFVTGKQVRNLYGHQNDGYSQPKLAWSQSGQYLIGNTQDESSLCVWDIATSTIVARLQGHGQCIRDLYSSPTSDTLISTSFDKQTKVWLPPSSS